MHPIFISYRRSDLSLEAEWIYNLIDTFFGSGIVFFDKEKIESGNRWDDTLRNQVDQAKIVLILIGPKWLKGQLDSGMRRLDDPKDWVRIEVKAAIDNFEKHPGERWVFPVLINDAPLPLSEWLPKELETLASFQMEQALVFHIKDYKEAARRIYKFMNLALARLVKAGLLDAFTAMPFHADKVPNPYELPGYQLPEELRTSRPALPFKGLEFFKREDARIFFGRRKETGEIIDYFKKSQHVIRLYGQSGVGKSSLLFGGLLPRLEAAGWSTLYFRRNIDKPVAQILKAAISKLQITPATSALIILDQLEEVITNPSPFAKNELEALSAQMLELEKINSERYDTPIRLIISYRKEYDVEIKNALRAGMVDSNEYWLKDLDETGMQEAIIGITMDQDLVDEYHLRIENNLDAAIIQDLVDSTFRSDATPLMQFVLRKMWDKVSLLDKDNRIFTKQLYDECKSSGLKELLLTQLALIPDRVDKMLKEAVESGLAVDVLKQFTTESDTTAAQSAAMLLDRYDDGATLTKLLRALVDVYLLVKTDNNTYRVPHDSLAKAIRIQCNNSVFPGQRASRLIDSKAQDIDEGKDVEFSRRDIAIIDAGKTGMRKWTANETAVIEKSRNKLAEQDLTFERLANESEIKAKKALSNYLTAQSMLAWNQKRNLTRATQLAANAAAVNPLTPSLKNLFYCYDMAYAFPTGQLLRSLVKLPMHASFACLNFDETKLILAGSNARNGVCAYDFEQKTIQTLFTRAKTIELLVCSLVLDTIFIYYEDRSAEIYNVASGESTPVTLPGKPESVVFWNESTLIHHSRFSIYFTDWTTGETELFAETEDKELIYTFACSDNGDFLAIATRTKKPFLLEIASLKFHLLTEHESIISHVIFLSGQQILIMDSWRGVYNLDFVKNESDTYQNRHEGNTMEGGTLLAYGDNGIMGFTDSEDKDTIHLLGPNKNYKITGMQEVFSQLLIKQDASCVITLGHGGVLLWPLHRTEKLIFTIAQDDTWVKLHHFADRALVFTATGIHIIDIFTQQPQLEYNIVNTAIDRDYYCQTGSDFFVLMNKKYIVRINLSTKESNTYLLPFEPEYARMGAGSNFLGVRGNDHIVHFYEFSSRQWQELPVKDGVWTIAFSTSDLVALGYQNGRIEIYSTDNFVSPVFAFQKMTKQIRCLHWSPDNKYLFGGGYNSFGVLCHLETKTFLKLQHAHWIGYAAFASTKDWIATCCSDKRVRIFLAKTGELLRELPLNSIPEQCHFTDSDRMLIIKLESEECIQWQLDDEKEILVHLENMRIEDLADEEKFELGIVDYKLTTKPGSDDFSPFEDELPMQVNFDKISFTSI